MAIPLLGHFHEAAAKRGRVSAEVLSATNENLEPHMYDPAWTRKPWGSVNLADTIEILVMGPETWH